MAKLPWFPLYAFDFLQDERVQLMTNEQVGMYVKLLCHQWIEGSIPEQSSSALAVLRLGWGDEREMPDYQQVIKDCFKPAQDMPGRLVNPRLETIRREQEDFSQRKQEAGRLGGYAKARLAVLGSCHDSASSKTLANPGKSEPKPKPESKKKSTSTPLIPLPDDWEPKDHHARFALARNLDLKLEAAHFRGRAMELEWVTKDWDRKFSNWMLQEIKFRQRSPR